MMIPLKELGDVKVGDTVEMKVASISHDMAMLEPAEAESPEDASQEDAMPTADEAQTMPMDQLEKRLPKASRD